MRTLIAIIIIGALIYLGWEKPFKERLHQANYACDRKNSGGNAHADTNTNSVAKASSFGLIVITESDYCR